VLLLTLVTGLILSSRVESAVGSHESQREGDLEFQGVGGEQNTGRRATPGAALERLTDPHGGM
jgi:hypothetical protein